MIKYEYNFRIGGTKYYPIATNYKQFISTGYFRATDWPIYKPFGKFLNQVSDQVFEPRLDQFLELGDFELIFFKEAKIEPKAKLEITTGQEKFQFGFHPTSK